MRFLRAGTAVALVAVLCGVPPAHAQQPYQSTVVVSDDSEPYPVTLDVNDADRATLRGDSRRPAPDDPVAPSPLDQQQAALDADACHAFFGPDATCPPDAVPKRELFAGVRVPRVFTTAAVEAAAAAPGDANAATTASPASSGGDRDLSWLQGLTLPDLPVHWSDRLVWYLEQFRPGGSYHNAVASWVQRSGRWARLVRDIFRRHGLPDDLLWVAAIESSFDPTERSSAGAVGIWQFMPEGGRDYGLHQDRWIDERRNPEKSTEAVALYFSDLYARFGSWDLALAGFNMGYAGLERAILKNGTNDYTTLSATENALPYGTSLYVPKIIAVAIVAHNLERFGLADAQPEPATPYDLVEVRGVTRVTALARAAGTSVEGLRALNPELLRDRTPPGEATWLVRVPSGAEEGFVQRLAAAREEDQSRDYTVRFGERLADVATRFRTTTARLRRLNGLGARDDVRGGDAIEVPDVEPRDLPAAQPAPTVVVPAETFVYPGRQRLFYRVLAGDTLDAIATAFGVTPTDLVTWNVIDPEATLTPGLILQVFAPPDFDPSTALVLSGDQVTVYASGSPELAEQLARQDGRERIAYVVRDGDTIESIARRFGTTKVSLVRVNHFGYSPDLHPGDEVIVYATPDQAASYRGEASPGAADGGSAAGVVPSTSP